MHSPHPCMYCQKHHNLEAVSILWDGRDPSLLPTTEINGQEYLDSGCPDVRCPDCGSPNLEFWPECEENIHCFLCGRWNTIPQVEQVTLRPIITLQMINGTIQFDVDPDQSGVWIRGLTPGQEDAVRAAMTRFLLELDQEVER